MQDAISICFSNGMIRAGVWKDDSFCLIPDRKGNTETPDVFYMDETGVSIGYPFREFDVQKGRYLNDVLSHIEDKDAIDGLSGQMCMSMVIGQLRKNAERFLGFYPRTMIFMVPFDFSSRQCYLLKQACAANDVRGRIMPRVFGIALDEAYRDRICPKSQEKLSYALAVFLDGPSVEIALADVDHDNQVVGIEATASRSFSFSPCSKAERILEFETAILEEVKRSYPDLLMMDRAQVIREVVEAALDDGEVRTLVIPYAAIYPNWMNTDEMTVTRSQFPLLKQEMKGFFSALMKQASQMGFEPLEHNVLSLDKQFLNDPLLEQVLLSEWKDCKNASVPEVDESGLSALRGAAMYAYNLNNPEAPDRLKCLLVPIGWKEYGILSHGEFVPMRYSSMVDPGFCDVSLVLIPTREKQTEIWVPLAEKYDDRICVFGHVVVECSKNEEILFNIGTGVDSSVDTCYVGETKNKKEIFYHGYEDYPERNFASHDFVIVRTIHRNHRI